MDGGTVLHLNLVGLMAAVEALADGGLRDRPFVVATPGLPRAVVLDLSPRAHLEGIRRGMPLEAARRALHGLLVLPPRRELYARADEELFRLAREYSPLVERAGPGHLFLDLKGTGRLFGAPPDCALRVRRRVVEATGLTPALSLASNKTVSKVATRVVRPGGFIVLEATEESALLRRQPVELLPGVGPVLLERLLLLELPDIGSLADLDAAAARALGTRGPLLVERARGVDTSPVDPVPPERRLLHAGREIVPDTTDPAILGAALRDLVEELGFRARGAGMGAARVLVGLTYADGLPGRGAATASALRSRDSELLALAREALGRARARRVRVRSLSLELGGLGTAGPELDLFEPEARGDRMQAALDRLRRRYGPAALRAASSLAAESRARGEAGSSAAPGDAGLPGAEATGAATAGAA